MYASVTITETGAVRAGAGALRSVLVTAGEDAASVTIYDNTTNSGTILGVVKAAINTSVSWSPAADVVCVIGLYAVVTGTAPSVTVVYT